MSRLLLDSRLLYPERTLTGAIRTPLDLQACVVWLDASQLALSNNDPVATWPNLAASENFTQATGSSQPTFLTNQLNGRPGVSFDGGDDLDGTISRNLLGHTIFAVVVPTDVSGPDVFIGNVSGNAAVNLRYFGGDQEALRESGGGSDIGGAVSNNTPYVNDYSRSTSGDYEWGLNGTTVASGNSSWSAVSSAAICIGARDSGNEQFAGTIHEVIIYSRILPARERQAVRDYLTYKWTP